MLYHTILSNNMYTILYTTLQHNTIPHYATLHYPILYYTTVLYYNTDCLCFNVGACVFSSVLDKLHKLPV